MKRTQGQDDLLEEISGLVSLIHRNQETTNVHFLATLEKEAYKTNELLAKVADDARVAVRLLRAIHGSPAVTPHVTPKARTAPKPKPEPPRKWFNFIHKSKAGR